MGTCTFRARVTFSQACTRLVDCAVIVAGFIGNAVVLRIRPDWEVVSTMARPSVCARKNVLHREIARGKQPALLNIESVSKR